MLMSYQAKPRNYCYHFGIVVKQIAHKLYTSALKQMLSILFTIVQHSNALL